MDWERDRGLAARIAGVVVLVALVDLGFVTAIRWFLTDVLAQQGNVRPHLGIDPLGPFPVPAVAVPATVCLVVLQYLYFRWAGVRDLPESDRHPPERVAETVGRFARQVGLPTPEVRVVRSSTPNSFAVGRAGDAAVVVTTGLLEALDDEQLAAVLAHEVAHVRNRDVAVLTLTAGVSRLSYELVRLARLVGLAAAAGVVAVPAVALVGFFLVGFAVLDGVSGTVATVLFGACVLGLPVTLGFRLLMEAAFVVSTPVASLLSRYREYAADRGAVALCGDPAALASALETIDGDAAPAVDARTVDRTAGALCVVPLRDPIGEFGAVDRGGESPFFTEFDWPARLSSTHPSAADRRDRLRDLVDRV